MTTLHSPRETASHEGAHAASLIAGGIMPLVARTDWPTDRLLGCVEFDWDEDMPDDFMREVLFCAIAGRWADGNGVEVTDWPIQPQHWLGCQADAKVAALAAQHLELDALGWSRFLYDAHKRFRSPLFRTLTAAISRELERVELLTRSELQAIAAPILAAFA